SGRAQREPDPGSLRAGSSTRAGRPTPGAFRMVGNPKAGRWSRAGPAPVARPELPTGSDHRRPGELLEIDLPAGSQGPPRPLPPPRLARGSTPGPRRGEGRASEWLIARDRVGGSRGGPVGSDSNSPEGGPSTRTSEDFGKTSG